jgi:hypothetical protein
VKKYKDMNSKDVTVIIPIHDVTKDFGVWFDKSILSIEQFVLIQQQLKNI